MLSTRTLVIALLTAGLVHWLMRLIPIRSVSYVVGDPTANSFNKVPLDYSLNFFLSNWEAIRPKLCLHATSNMPGKSLLYYLLSPLYARNKDVIGIILLIFSNMGGVILFYLCRHFTKDRRVGVTAMLLYWLYPARMYYFPVLNAITPTFLLLSFFLFVRALEQSSLLRIFLAGAALFTLFLFEPIPFICGFFYLFVCWLFWKEGKTTPLQIVKVCAGTVLAFFLTHFLFWGITGLNVISAFVTLLSVNETYNKSIAPPNWFLWTIVTFVIGLGWGTLSTFVIAIGRRKPHFKGYFAIWLFTLLILAASGMNKSENLRMWIFLGPMLFPFLGFVYADRPKLFRVAALVNLTHACLAMYHVAFVY